MKKIKIPFYKTSAKVDERLEKCLSSGWMTSGPVVQEFENSLANYIDVEHVVSVNSCTAGLHLSLAAQNIKEEDFVIVPTLTFVATAEVVEYFGANVILCDIDPKTLCIDVNEIEYHAKKLGGKLKFVMPVHFAGFCADMKNIVELSEKYNFKIIEDAAHALESFSNIGKVGDNNHCTAFSFYANKNLTTGGEGGAVSTNDGNLAKKIKKLSLHGMTKDAWNRFSENGKWFYQVDELGYKYNLTDVAASIGLQQLSELDLNHAKRKKIAQYYDNLFDRIPSIDRYHYDEAYKHAYHLYIINIRSDQWSISRNELINEINGYGIGTSVHYIPLHTMPYYKQKYGYKDNEFPNSSNYFSTCISIPIYPMMDNKDMNYINEVFTKLSDQYQK